MLLFFQFNFRGCTDTNDGNATGQLGQTFLQFFAVVIGGAAVDLDLDLLDTAVDLILVALTVNDGGLIFGGDNLRGATQVADL